MDLPRDVFMDILLRLPIKTISSCRLVCKTWFNIISDPKFTHVNKSPPCLFLRLHNDLRHGLSPSLSSSSSRTLYLIDLEADEITFNTTFNLPKYDGNTKLGKLTILNSCNGFLCLCRSDYHIIVFNPVTGEQMTLPKPNRVENIKAGTHTVFGFGFSSRTNQYKVVRMVYQNLVNSNTGKYELVRVAQVHTLGTRYWRTIGNAPLLQCKASSATFLNGVIHWLVDDDDCSDFICSFEVGNEEFGTVLPPSSFKESQEGDYYKKDRSMMSMRVLRDCLCICDSSLGSIDIWVMNDYGVQESWTADFQIRNEDHDSWREIYKENLIYRGFVGQAIKYLKNGELVVLVGEDDLVFCDPVRNGVRCFKIQGFQSNFETIVHVPNFILLKDICCNTNTDMDTGHPTPTHQHGVLRLNIRKGFGALSLLEDD